MPVRRSSLPVAALAAACVIWGASFLLGKVALRELSPSAVVFWRFLVGSLCVLPLALRRPRLTRRDGVRLVVAAFLGVPALFLLQVEGLALTTATRAALLIGLIPPLTALGATAVLRERPTPRTWTAAAVSSLGLGLLVGLPHAAGHLGGDLLVVASVVVCVAYLLQVKLLVARGNAAAVSAYVVLLGTVLLVPCVLLLDGVPPLPRLPATWAALVGLGAGCTGVAYVLWNWGLQHLDASRAGLFVNIEPLFGALLGIAVLGEPLSLGVVLGGSLILIAALRS